MENKKCIKVKYWSKKEAKTALLNINRNFKNNNLKDVYFCEDCIMWHTTAIDKETNRALNRIKTHQNERDGKAFTGYQSKNNRLPKDAQKKGDI